MTPGLSPPGETKNTGGPATGMSESMAARLAVAGRGPGHRRRECWSRKLSCRRGARSCQDLDGGSDGGGDDGSLVGDEPDDVGVGSVQVGDGSVHVGDGACVDDESEGVEIGAAEELVGVGVGVRVGRGTGQVCLFVLV
jgi:hypothetical protein